jgi:hypothetical protein
MNYQKSKKHFALVKGANRHLPIQEWRVFYGGYFHRSIRDAMAAGPMWPASLPSWASVRAGSRLQLSIKEPLGVLGSF